MHPLHNGIKEMSYECTNHTNLFPPVNPHGVFYYLPQKGRKTSPQTASGQILTAHRYRITFANKFPLNEGPWRRIYIQWDTFVKLIYTVTKMDRVICARVCSVAKYMGRVIKTRSLIINFIFNALVTFCKVLHKWFLLARQF